MGVAVQHGGTSVKTDHLLAWMSDFQGCGQMTGAAAEVSPQAAPDGAATAQLGQAPGHGPLQQRLACIGRCCATEALQHLVGANHRAPSHCCTTESTVGVISAWPQFGSRCRVSGCAPRSSISCCADAACTTASCSPCTTSTGTASGQPVGRLWQRARSSRSCCSRWRPRLVKPCSRGLGAGHCGNGVRRLCRGSGPASSVPGRCPGPSAFPSEPPPQHAPRARGAQRR